VRLVSHRAEALTLVDDAPLFGDVQSLRGRFDVIRVANVMNRISFSEPELRLMARNLRARLVPAGGLIVQGRTNGRGVNDFSIFELDGAGRAGVVHRVGLGSEIESLILLALDGGIMDTYARN
ncbi:MAG: hypothetical protein WCK65_13895, partial [Rhodospirillaceae bacterium]